MALAFERAAERGRGAWNWTPGDQRAGTGLYRRHGFSERSKDNDGRDLLLGVQLGELA